MRRLPATFRRVLEEAPRRCPRRKHIMGLVQWRLARGMSFTSQEIVAAAKFRTTKRFVESNLDALMLQGVLMQNPDKTYACAERNKNGLDAALLKFAEEHPSFTRKEAWMSLPSSLTENGMDRLLRRLETEGKITRVGRGRYQLGQVDVEAAPKAARLKVKPKKAPTDRRADLHLVAEAA